MIYQRTTRSAFKSAKVTLSHDWKDRYDQGGLVLVINPNGERKWIKTGIEFENGQPNVGTVAMDRWSDWSLLPLNGNSATIEARLESGSIWIYYIEGSKRTALREVTFWADLPEDAEIWVGVFVAKPAPNGEKGDLTVDFKDLRIELD